MNKKGFAIIEVLIVVMMLTVSLLLIYTSYKNSLNEETKRLYYDDITSIYKTNSIKKYLVSYIDENKLSTELVQTLKNKDLYISSDMYEDISNIFSTNNVDEILLLKNDSINIKLCNFEDINSENCIPFKDMNYDLFKYINTINYKSIKESHILVISYKTNKDGTSCQENCVINYSNIAFEVEYE